MKVLFSQRSQKAASFAFALLLLIALYALPPIKTRALQAIAVTTATTVFVTTAVVIACQFNLFGICPPPSSGSSGGSSGTTVTPATNSDQTGDSSGNTGGTGGASGSASGDICFSAQNAVCGISSQGTLVNGVCNATTPPNSACPAPIIDSSSGFYADPALVRSGNTSTLHWSVTNATACAISGSGLDLQGLGITGSTLTGPVTSKSVYTLTCLNGSGGPSTSSNTFVNLVPTTIEQ